MCSALETHRVSVSLRTECSELYLPKKEKKEESTAASSCSMDSSGGVREEEMNEGQMVSSAGLCSALQRKDPAEFNKHNNLNFFFFFFIGRLSDLSLGWSRCVASRKSYWTYCIYCRVYEVSFWDRFPYGRK